MPPRLYTVPEDRGRGPRGAPLRRLPPAGGKEPLARLRLQSAVVPARDCRIATITEHLCQRCREHFGRFKSYLAARGIQFQVNPRLVRGIDYYTRTTFEINSGRLGSQKLN